MAKDSWLTVSPMSGTGNAVLTNSSTLYKGRVERQTTVTAVVKGVESAKSYQVKQEPTAEYIELDDNVFEVDGDKIKIITISGRSNSPILNFSVPAGSEISMVAPSNYLLDGAVPVTSGESIPNDPGASREFTFSAKVSIPKNTVGERLGEVIITGSSSFVSKKVTVVQSTSTYSIIYSAGDYVSVDKTSEIVDYGRIATATATLFQNTDEYSYSFSGWYEGGIKISSSLKLSVENITSSRTFTAIGSRIKKKYSLGFEISPEGSGTVSGGGTYDYGSEIQSEATPDTGYDFEKWVDEDGTEYTDNPYPGWFIDKNRTIQAIFALQSYQINLSSQYRIEESGNFITGVAGGQVSGGGTYDYGTLVTVRAATSVGYNFDGWYEGSTKVSDLTAYTFEAETGRNLIARFQRKWFTITFEAGEGGSVLPTSARVQYDGEASSTATASSGYKFSGWSDGTTSETLTVSNVRSDATYKAMFDTDAFIITGVAQYRDTDSVGSFITGENGGTVTGSGAYNSGDKATLTASYNTGYTLQGWYDGSGALISSAVSYVIESVSEDVTVYARFQRTWFTVTYIQGAGVEALEKTSERVARGNSVTSEKAVASIGYENPTWTKTSGLGTLTVSDGVATLSNVRANCKLTASASVVSYEITPIAYYRTASSGNYTEGTVGGTVGGGGTYNYGDSATITATAATGFAFAGWYTVGPTGGSYVSRQASYTISNITADRTLYARFYKRYYTINYSAGDYISSVSRTNESVSYGGTALGSTATLMATTAQYMYEFDGWYQGTTKVSSSLTWKPSNVTATATYQAKGRRILRSYNISVSLDKSVSERGSVSGGGTYDYGSTATVVCNMMNTNDVFDGWYENGVRVSTDASYEFTVTDIRILIAKILYLDVSSTNISIGNTGGSKTFTVSTNTDWTIS